jgi:nucleosome assembly protein 1-like 1
MTITDRDKDALKHLVDVRLEYLDGEPGSFQLSFHFAPNPFFTNAVLRKRFFYKSDAVTGIIKPSHTEAPDKIDWKKGMDLSVIIEKKKKKGKGKLLTFHLVAQRTPDWHSPTNSCTGKLEGSQKSRVVQETVPADTFFEFFNQPQSTSSKKGGGDDDDDTDDWLQLEMDFETGEKFKNQIIPHAVNWYTGEAAEDEWEDNSYDDEEQEEEDSDDQEDSADNAETDEDSE